MISKVVLFALLSLVDGSCVLPGFHWEVVSRATLKDFLESQYLASLYADIEVKAVEDGHHFTASPTPYPFKCHCSNMGPGRISAVAKIM